MTRNNPNLKLKLQRLLRPWHRRLGIISALFLIMLAITGVAINHSHDMTIDTLHVRQPWLLDYYGISAADEIKVYQTEPKLIAVTDNQLWIGNHMVWQPSATINSVTLLPQFIVATTHSTLAMISHTGELIEVQDQSTGLPASIQFSQRVNQQLWLSTASGVFVADDAVIEWHRQTSTTPLSPNSSIPLATIDSQLLSTLTLNARSVHLTWERVLLDIHSGRIFGKVGTLAVDLMALLFIITSTTGIIIWWQQKPKN